MTVGLAILLAKNIFIFSYNAKLYIRSLSF